MSKLIFGQGTQLTALPQGNDIASGSISLEKITDVNLSPDTLTASEDGQILQFSNASSAFLNVPLNLNRIADVDLTPDTMTASEDGHILQYDHSVGKFVNVAFSTIQITEVDGGSY